jgi:hypothetical protein
VVSAAALIAAVGFAFPGVTADRVTVGDFVIRIASAKRLPAASCDGAADSLRQAGFAVPMLECGTPLTEGHVATISESIGIKVTTSRPAAAFGEAQVDAYFTAFARQVSGDPDAPGTGTDEGTDPLTKGKGKKKGLRSPDDPV